MDTPSLLRSGERVMCKVGRPGASGSRLGVYPAQGISKERKVEDRVSVDPKTETERRGYGMANPYVQRGNVLPHLNRPIVWVLYTPRNSP